MKYTTVAIVEDQKEIREMQEALVKEADSLCFLQSFENAEEALVALPELQPDVVLVDIHLPKMTGIELVFNLKSVCSNTKFIMCTSLEDTETIFSALKAGANGYISKTAPLNKLIEAIDELRHGGAPMSSQIARKVVESFQVNQTANTHFESLSKREQEILKFLSKGYRYKEIAAKLELSLETVRTHVRNIYEKLQVNSRTDALNKVQLR